MEKEDQQQTLEAKLGVQDDINKQLASVESKKKRRRKVLIVTLTLLVIVVIVAIAVPLALREDSSGKN